MPRRSLAPGTSQARPNFASTCAAAGSNPAVVAACDVARKNNSSLANADIKVNIPPIDGQYRALPAVIQVRINTNHGSIFGGVIGRAAWPVGVNAVAANQKGVTYGFGMLALDPTGCKAILISGTGVVNSAGNVQANSDGSELAAASGSAGPAAAPSRSRRRARRAARPGPSRTRARGR